jgi:hypothetical protein
MFSIKAPPLMGLKTSRLYFTDYGFEAQRLFMDYCAQTKSLMGVFPDKLPDPFDEV